MSATDEQLAYWRDLDAIYQAHSARVDEAEHKKAKAVRESIAIHSRERFALAEKYKAVAP